MRPSLLVEVAELAVTVGMLGALQRLGRTLQPVALLAQQPTNGVGADRMALRGERLGQLPGGLARPPQRTLRIATGVGVHQPVQRPKQARIGVAPPLGPSCWRTRPLGSAGWSSSAAPRRTVGRDASASRATRLTPPYPSARAAAPNSSRRCRSVRCGATSENIAASTSSRSTPGSYFNYHTWQSGSTPRNVGVTSQSRRLASARLRCRTQHQASPPRPLDSPSSIGISAGMSAPPAQCGGSAGGGLEPSRNSRSAVALMSSGPAASDSLARRQAWTSAYSAST
jgi:hypothetical protein